jgi:glutaredoxin 3
MNAEIYTKSICPYCTRAKRIFEKENISYTEINAVENLEELKTKVIAAIGSPPQKVPQIWIDEKYIGGYDQLVSWVEKMKTPLIENSLSTI